jgi:hypothetical protein
MFLIILPVDEHLGWSRDVAAGDRAAINIGVQCIYSMLAEIPLETCLG